MADLLGPLSGQFSSLSALGRGFAGRGLEAAPNQARPERSLEDRFARVFDAVPFEGGRLEIPRPQDLANSAKQVIKDALGVMKRDLVQVVKAMGLGEGVAKALSKAIIQPVVDALRAGVDFTAKITFAAIQQQTLVTNSGVQESLSLIAKSLDITVNQSTGEVSVTMQSLSIEKTSSVSFDGAPPAFFDSPGSGEAGQPAGDALRQLLERLLAEPEAKPVEASRTPADTTRELLEASGGEASRGDDAKAAHRIEKDHHGEKIGDSEALGDDDGFEFAGDDDDGDVEDEPNFAVQVPLPAVELQRPEDSLVGLRTRFAIRSVEQFQNSLGQQLTQIRLDAALTITPFLQPAPLVEAVGDEKPGPGGINFFA